MVVVKLSTSRLKLSEQQVQPNVTVAKTETLFCDDGFFFLFPLLYPSAVCRCLSEKSRRLSLSSNQTRHLAIPCLDYAAYI